MCQRLKTESWRLFGNGRDSFSHCRYGPNAHRHVPLRIFCITCAMYNQSGGLNFNRQFTLVENTTWTYILHMYSTSTNMIFLDL